MKATRQTAHIRALLALFLALLMLLSMAACGTKGDKGNEESTSTDTDSETTDGFLDLEITDTKTIYCNRLNTKAGMRISMNQYEYQ